MGAGASSEAVASDGSVEAGTAAGLSSVVADTHGKDVHVLPFTEEQLQEYVDCTFFSRKQVIKVHRRFYQYSKTRPERLTRDEFFSMPEFKHHPLRERIVEVFSQSLEGDLYFEDFLDFLSVFSLKSSVDVKASYAFRLFDVDNDGYLGEQDLRHVLSLLTGTNLSAADTEFVLSKLFEEGDLDGDRQISYIEFENILKKSSDFVRHFRMSIF